MTAPCDGCGAVVSVHDLSQEDTEDAPRLCLVCVWPEFYRYDVPTQRGLPL